jgi:sulfite reductase beta subunit-like hemoprotein
VRNVAASPLGGRLPGAPLATDAVVAELDHRLCADPALAALPGRFAFAVDDGTATLGGRTPDVLLRGEPGGPPRLVLAGVATDLRGGARLAVAAARAFLALRDADGPWRIADLPDGAARVAGALGGRLLARDPGPGRGAPPPVGALRQEDGRVALTALPPLARLDLATLDALGRLAPRGVRLSARRTVTVVDVEPDAVAATTAALARAGLVTGGASGWSGLSACAGLGACARARADVRAAATARAAVRAPGDPPEHWSACPRACGRPPGATAVTAVDGDGYVIAGDGGDVHVSGIPAALERLGARA